MNAADVRLLFEILCGLSLVVLAVGGVIDGGKTPALASEQDEKLINVQPKIERRTPWSSLSQKALAREKRREMVRKNQIESTREKINEMKGDEIVPGLEKDTDDPEGVVHTLDELRAMKPGTGVQWRDQMPIAGNGKGSELKRRKRRGVGLGSNGRTNARISGARVKTSGEHRVNMNDKRDAKRTLKKKSAFQRNFESQKLNNENLASDNIKEARATSLTERQHQAEPSLRQGAGLNKKEKPEHELNVAEGKEVVDSLVRSNLRQVLTSGLEGRQRNTRESVLRNKRYIRRDEDDEGDNDDGDDEDDDDDDDDDERRDRRKRHAKMKRFTTDPDASRGLRGRRQDDEWPRASTQAGLRQLMKDVESIAVDDDLAFDAMSSPNLDSSPDNVPELFDHKKLGIKRKKRQSSSVRGIKKAEKHSNEVLLEKSKHLQVELSGRMPGGLRDVHRPGIKVSRRKRSTKDEDEEEEGGNDDDDNDDDDDDVNGDGDRDRKKREARKETISSLKARVNKIESYNATKLSSRENLTRNIEKQLLEIVKDMKVPESLKNGFEKTLKSLSGIKLEDAGKLLQNPAQWLRLKRHSDDDQDEDYSDGENDEDRGDYSERNDGNGEDGRGDETGQDDDASNPDENAEAVHNGVDGPGDGSYEKTVVKVSKVKSNPHLITTPPKDIGSQLVKLQEEEEKEMATMAPTLSPRKRKLDSSLRELTAKLDKIEDDLKRKEAIQRARISKRSYSRIQDGKSADNDDFGLGGETFDNKYLASSSNEPSGSSNTEISFEDTEDKSERDIRKNDFPLKRRSLSSEKTGTIKVGRLPKWMLKMNEIVAEINGDIADLGVLKTIGNGMGEGAVRREGESKSNLFDTQEKEESGRAKRDNARQIKNMLNVHKGQRVSGLVKKVGPSGEKLPNAIEVVSTATSNRNDSQRDVMRKKSNAVGGNSKVSNPVKHSDLLKSSVASLFSSRLQQLLALKRQAKNETRKTIQPILFNKQTYTFNVVPRIVHTKKQDYIDNNNWDKRLEVDNRKYLMNTNEPKASSYTKYSSFNEKLRNGDRKRMNLEDSNFIRRQKSLPFFVERKRYRVFSPIYDRLLDSTGKPSDNINMFEALIILTRVEPRKSSPWPDIRSRMHRPLDRAGPDGSRGSKTLNSRILKVVKILTSGQPREETSDTLKTKHVHQEGGSKVQNKCITSWEKKRVHQPSVQRNVDTENEVADPRKDTKRIASLLLDNPLGDSWKHSGDKHAIKKIRLLSKPNRQENVQLRNMTVNFKRGKAVFHNYSNTKRRLKSRNGIYKMKSDQVSKRDSKNGRQKIRNQRGQNEQQINTFASNYSDLDLDIPHLSYRKYENLITDLLKFPLDAQTYRRLRRWSGVKLPLEKDPETPTERALKKEIMQLLRVFPENVAEKKSGERLELMDAKDEQSSDLAATIVRIDEEDNEPFLDTEEAGDLFSQKQRVRKRSVKDVVNEAGPAKRVRSSYRVNSGKDFKPGLLSRTKKYVSPYKKIHPENNLSARNRLMDNSLADGDTSSSFDSQETYFRAMPYLIAQDNSIAQSATQFNTENSQIGVLLRDSRTPISKTIDLPDIGLVNLSSPLLSSETDIRQLKSDNDDAQRNDEEIEELDVKHYDELLRGGDDVDDEDDGDNEESDGGNTDEVSGETNSVSRKRRSTKKKNRGRLNNDDSVNEIDSTDDENGDDDNDEDVDDDRKDGGSKGNGVTGESGEIMNYENLIKVKQNVGDMAEEKAAGVDTPVFDGNYPPFENNSQQVNERQPEETDYLDQEENQEPDDIEFGDDDDKEEDEVIFVDTQEDGNIEVDDNGKRVEPIDEVAFIEEDPVTTKPDIYAWGDWSECSVTCGIGQRFRTNRCPEGQPCIGKAASNEMEVCSDRDC